MRVEVTATASKMGKRAAGDGRKAKDTKCSATLGDGQGCVSLWLLPRYSVYEQHSPNQCQLAASKRCDPAPRWQSLFLILVRRDH